MNIAGYIPNTGRFKYEKDDFIYHSEEDYYECRNGKAIKFSGLSENDRRYTIGQRHCLGCPFKDSCIGNKKYMSIKVTADKPYYDQMHIRMQTRKAKILMKLRQSTVEPVIGTLMNYLGIKKVNTKGLEQANKCLTMAAVAYKLKKMLKYQLKLIQQKALLINDRLKAFCNHLCLINNSLHNIDVVAIAELSLANRAFYNSCCATATEAKRQ